MTKDRQRMALIKKVFNENKMDIQITKVKVLDEWRNKNKIICELLCQDRFGRHWQILLNPEGQYTLQECYKP